MKRLRTAWLAAIVAPGLCGVTHARVTRMIDEVQPLPEPVGAPAGAIAFEQITAAARAVAAGFLVPDAAAGLLAAAAPATRDFR
jgi:hypothetical protein